MLKSLGGGSNSPARTNRLNFIGDSHLGFGFRPNTLATSAGKFVVSGGIATLDNGGTFFGNCVGNYVYLSNLGDRTYANSLNGACVPILTAPSNSTMTVSATFNGQTMADGDYSNVGGVGWEVKFLSFKTDSSFLHWIQAFNGNPCIVTSLNATIGQFSQDCVTLLPKIMAGPAFDTGVISLGTNDMQTNVEATAMQNAYRSFRAVKIISDTLLAAGKSVIIYIPNPDAINNGNSLPKTKAIGTFRRLVFEYSRKNRNVQTIDGYAITIDGTSSTAGGTVQSGYVKSGDNHLSTVGNYQVQKQSNINKIITPSTDVQPVSILEDQATFAQLATAWVGSTAYTAATPTPDVVRNGANIYFCIQSGTSASSGGPTGTGSSILDGTVLWAFIHTSSVNIVSHGMMDGTTGTNNTAGAIVGNVPTGWTLAAATTTGTTTPQAARTAITGTNAAKWGYGWQISAVFAGSGNTITISQEMVSRLVKGSWYQFGITLTALNAWSTNVNKLQCYIQSGGGSAFFQPSAIYDGNNTTTFPLTTNDVMELASEPFLVPAGYDGTQFIFNFIMTANAAATVNFELASAWCRQIEDPTSY